MTKVFVTIIFFRVLFANKTFLCSTKHKRLHNSSPSRHWIIHTYSHSQYLYSPASRTFPWLSKVVNCTSTPTVEYFPCRLFLTYIGHPSLFLFDILELLSFTCGIPFFFILTSCLSSLYLPDFLVVIIWSFHVTYIVLSLTFLRFLASSFNIFFISVIYSLL